MQRKRTSPAVFKRAGLHKLECDCGGSVYATVASLERHGLPQCGCGARLVPDRLELALLLGVNCPAVAEYESELNKIAHGQAGPGRALRNQGKTFRDPTQVAAERVERRRRERARENRLSALRAPEPAMPF